MIASAVIDVIKFLKKKIVKCIYGFLSIWQHHHRMVSIPFPNCQRTMAVCDECRGGEDMPLVWRG